MAADGSAYPKPDLSRHTPPRPKPKRSFILPGWSLAAALVLVIAAGIANVALAGSTDPEQLGRALGAVMGSLLFSYLLAAVVGVFARDAGAVLFVILTAVLSLSVVARGFVEKKEREQAVLDGLNASASKLERRAGAILQEGGDGAKTADLMAEYRRGLEDAKGQLSGSSAVGAEVMAAYMGHIEAALRVHARTLADVEASGALDFSKIKAREDIDKARKAARTFRAANEELIRLQAKFESVIFDELKARNVEDKDAKSFLEGVKSGMNAPAARQKRERGIAIRQIDIEVADSAVAVLDVLEREWGRWRIGEGGALELDNDEAVAKVNVHLVAIQQASERQTALQAELMPQP